jgi:hypothetical protein
MKRRHVLGSLSQAAPEEQERFRRLYDRLREWCQDDANVADEDAQALVNALLSIAVQLAQQLKGDRDTFVKAASAVWDAHKKASPS